MELHGIPIRSVLNYKNTIEFLFSQLPAYHRVGKAAYKSDLTNIMAFDDYLNHPHKNYRCIHVGGTNGKGSVSHMIASVFMEAGYKTGLYTSPHLTDFRERIRVNGRKITKSAVIRFIKNNWQFIRKLEPSFFEMTVAMAFDYFARRKVDVAVIEVGLGGRLDSTNIILPELSVVTNIGHDHMDLLGDSPGKIAMEKAGIIKPGIPVVISETQAETSSVFIDEAKRKSSMICFADENYHCKFEAADSRTGKSWYVVEDKKNGNYFRGRTQLSVEYQTKNIQSVFQVAELLKDTFNLNNCHVISGINNVTVNTHLEGRWQIIGHKPLVICDTAHNREGLEIVLDQINKIPATQLHMVLGFVNDKDLSLVLPLFPHQALYYFTKASVPRALNERILMEKASEFGLKGDCYPDVISALESAREHSSATDLIFVGGSTFVVADALK
jgi:dihydrofolate synthase/folylpolyglutamate synthase